MHIHHAAVYVLDLEGAKDFFIKYFGAQPSQLYHNQKTTFRSYFLTFDSGAALEIMTRDDLVPARAAEMAAGACQYGWAHLCFSVGSAAAVDSKVAELKAAGFAVLSGPRTTGDGFYEAVVELPGGAQLEITI